MDVHMNSTKTGNCGKYNCVATKIQLVPGTGNHTLQLKYMHYIENKVKHKR